MLGDQIKYLRHLHKISQVKLAEEIGVTKQTVSNWENNNIMPSVELLKKLSIYFSCSTDYLLELNQGSTELFIDTYGLEDQQIVHLQQIANDYKELLRNNIKKGCDFCQKSRPFFMINPSPSAHDCLCPFLSRQASFLPAPLIH